MKTSFTDFGFWILDWDANLYIVIGRLLPASQRLALLPLTTRKPAACATAAYYPQASGLRYCRLLPASQG
ncbi:MAG: hypothetical protein AB1791_23080, partial [Chloroflexota bacterium]